MGSSANDLIAVGGELRAMLEQRGCPLTGDFDFCGLENRLCIERFILDIFGATGQAKSTYRDVMFAIGCLNIQSDYDRLLGLTGRRR